MPSDTIVADARLLIQNKLLPTVPTKWWPQLSFGLEAFALQPFQSAGSNARSVITNPNTAASKVRRLLANDKLAAQLGVVFDQLDLVKPSSYVNIDHSDFNGLTALVGAAQTRNGRAIPCMVETTYALHIPGEGSRHDTPRWQRLRTDMQFARASQSFTGHNIDALQDLAERLGFWPRLVFDRGFVNESIVEHLTAEGATFYIRLKGGNYTECDGQITKVAHLGSKDTAVRLFGMTLRVVRSPKSKQDRFEIEETFKDTKHLFELQQLNYERPTSLKMVLWLVFLGIAVLYVVVGSKRHQKNTNAKKYVSWIRQAYERFQRVLVQYRALTGLTPRFRGQV